MSERETLGRMIERTLEATKGGRAVLAHRRACERSELAALLALPLPSSADSAAWWEYIEPPA